MTRFAAVDRCLCGLRRWSVCWTLAFSFAVALTASAQSPIASAPQIENDPHTVRGGERLSDWMLRQAFVPAPYWPGLRWSVPEQRLPQHDVKHALIAALAASPELKAPVDARERLAHWLTSVPVTGRVPIELADARWLQSHPEFDPILARDHHVEVPATAPRTLTVISEAGRRCRVPHQSGTQVKAYLAACDPGTVDEIDLAWIVQPDGRVFRYGIAAWNEEKQGELAPGAWIWAPARNSGWPERFSDRFARFIATIGPALDADEGGQSPIPTALPELASAGKVTARPPARSAGISASDWGVIGLLQTPTARMAEDGEIRFHYSSVSPYGRGTVMFQPLDWLEAGFRYTNISNRLYGPDIAGSQDYKDKSLDFKLRLAKESARLPEVALGTIDIGGTGLFSSEYLVANKRYGDFDVSLGMAWGYLGGRGMLRNPLSILGSGFDTRAGSDNVSGGTVNTKSFFHGRPSLFGGVQYQTPWEGLLAKIEVDGNNYQHEPQANNQKATSPINVGLSYSYSPSIDVSAGFERGNTLMVGFSFHGPLNKLAMPKILNPAHIPIATTRPQQDPAWSHTAEDLKVQTQWQVIQIARQGSELQVVFENPRGVYWQERIERAIRVLHRDAPASINRFVLSFRDHGLPMSEQVVLRHEWLADQVGYRAPLERLPGIAAIAPRGRIPGDRLWSTEPERYHFGVAPHFQQSLGGPEGFILYQAGVHGIGKVRLGESTWMSGRANYRLIDNYKNFKYDGPSLLPRVRTDIRQYVTTTPLTLPNLQITHVGQLSESQFYSVYGGYLESMFAGVGGEWLYRPWHSPVAFGIDVNHVQQRNFRQDFALRDYRANTGHATLYWDTGWKSTHVNLSAGQYLAKDRGVTLDVSRKFENGVTIGAYASKTNVSAATFGEGSFDKGIYVLIPFEAILPLSSPAVGMLNWSPLMRDGGARLARAEPLYALTNARDRKLLGYRPANSTASSIQPGTAAWAEPDRSLFGSFVESSGTAGHKLLSGNYSDVVLPSALMIGGAALFDRSIDRWAQKQGQGTWKKLGNAAASMPIAIGLGTTLLWMGLGDDMASDTAWTSIKAAGIALASETILKTVVGRARPDANLGERNFSTGRSNSSFPSIQVGVAFAMVTPFAEKYDAPWLYGAAAATAFGRIQQRQHFLSDTVAGGLIGYAIGSLLAEEQRNRKAPQLSLGEDRMVRAHWQF